MAPIISEYLPSGSGFDSGTSIDVEKTTEEKLVFSTAFHHMNDLGYYVGWTEHRVTVRPSFYGFDIKVSGRNRNDIKDHIAECFDYVLSEATGENLAKKYMDVVKALRT
jgi:hypothetical protein